MEIPTSESSMLKASLPVSVQYKQQSVLRTVQKTLETKAISKLATHKAFLKIKLYNINTIHKTKQSQNWARHGIALQELHCACSAICMLCVQFKAIQRGCTMKHGQVLPEMAESLQIWCFICFHFFLDRVSCSAGPWTSVLPALPLIPKCLDSQCVPQLQNKLKSVWAT